MSAAYSLTSKGQVTIPKEIRKTLGLKEHDKVIFVKKGSEIVIKAAKGNIFELRGSIKPKSKPEDFEKIRKIAREKAIGRNIISG